MRLFTLTKAFTIAAILATTAGSAHALVYSFSDASTFNGGPSPTATPGSPGSSTVYATATFSDTSAGVVQLVMRTLTNLSPYYLNDWAFNFVNGTLITSITHTTADIAATKVTLDPNNFKLTGAGDPIFDFGFNFSTANPGQLAFPNTSTYLITGISAGFNSNVFNSVSFNQDGSTTPAYSAAIHVQGGPGQSYAVSGNDRGGSQGTVPEPGSVALIGLGILGVALVRRRTRRIDG